MLRSSSGLITLLLATCCWLTASFCRADDAAVIAVTGDILPDYNSFVRDRELMSIQDYSGVNARRDVIELVLLQQALRLGGFTQPLKLQAEQSYLRTMRGIADGRFITSAGLAWQEDINTLPEAFYTSSAVIKNGEFAVGVYTSQYNLKALAARNRTELSQLAAVTSSQWKTDIKALDELGIKRILFSPNWINMVRMIEANRADITLAPFQQTADMSVQVGGIKLVPIKGIKVVFNGSRHWPISRKHPQGEAFYQALERGLKQLEARGIRQKAYRDCGFFHPEIAHWKQL